MVMKNYRPVVALAIKREDQWLLVRKPRKRHAWQFPQGGVDEGETFINAAQRELIEECGPDLRVNIFPEQIAGYQYDFPSDFMRYDNEFDGASVEFFYAQWVFGEPIVDGDEIVEARWCSSEEIQYLVEENYWEAVKGIVK